MLKTVSLSYADFHNLSVQFLVFEVLQNISNADISLVDAADYDTSAFTLPSVVPFYSLTLGIPSFNKLDKWKYFALPFTRIVWMFHILFPFYFAIILKINSPSKSKTLRNIFEAVRAILTGQVRFLKKDKPLRFIYFFVLFYGMFFWIGYSSHLGSFLTQALDQTDFPFLCTKTRAKAIGSEHVGKLKFSVQSTDDYLKKIYALNLQNGYCFTSMFWYYNMGFQKYMSPIFRQIIPWKFAYGHYFRINKKSKHLDRFNRYLLNVYSSGLHEKWGQDMSIANSISLIRQHLVGDNPILGLQDFMSPIKLCAFCLFLSIVAFLSEIFFSLFLKNDSRNNGIGLN